MGVGVGVDVGVGVGVDVVVDVAEVLHEDAEPPVGIKGTLHCAADDWTAQRTTLHCARTTLHCAADVTADCIDCDTHTRTILHFGFLARLRLAQGLAYGSRKGSPSARAWRLAHGRKGYQGRVARSC